MLLVGEYLDSSCALLISPVMFGNGPGLTQEPFPCELSRRRSLKEFRRRIDRYLSGSEVCCAGFLLQIGNFSLSLLTSIRGGKPLGVEDSTAFVVSGAARSRLVTKTTLGIELFTSPVIHSHVLEFHGASPSPVICGHRLFSLLFLLSSPPTQISSPQWIRARRWSRYRNCHGLGRPPA